MTRDAIATIINSYLNEHQVDISPEHANGLALRIEDAMRVEEWDGLTTEEIDRRVLERLRLDSASVPYDDIRNN